MAKLTFNGHVFQVEGQSILDCLSENGQKISSGCKAGICQSCLVQITQGAIPPNSQIGLDLPSIDQGLVLACQARPNHDLTIGLPPDRLKQVYPGRLRSRRQLASGVFELVIFAPDYPAYRAGQFAYIHKDSQTARPYSFASAPQPGKDLVFHIASLAGGRVSPWLTSGLGVGDPIDLGAPHGHAVYQADGGDQGLLLVGTGTGLAPLRAIVEAARLDNYRGPIALYHGVKRMSGLYGYDELTAWQTTWPSFQYVPCVSQGDVASTDIRKGRASDLALQDYPDLSGWRVYLCGNPDMVSTTAMSAFLAGASMAKIHSDPFLPAAV